MSRLDIQEQFEFVFMKNENIMDLMNGLNHLHKETINLFINSSFKTQEIEFDSLKNIMKDDFAKKELNAVQTNYTIKDLWTKKNFGTIRKMFKGKIQSHDLLMIRLIT